MGSWSNAYQPCSDFSRHAIGKMKLIFMPGLPNSRLPSKLSSQRAGLKLSLQRTCAHATSQTSFSHIFLFCSSCSVRPYSLLLLVKQFFSCHCLYIAHRKSMAYQLLCRYILSMAVCNLHAERVSVLIGEPVFSWYCY